MRGRHFAVFFSPFPIPCSLLMVTRTLYRVVAYLPPKTVGTYAPPAAPSPTTPEDPTDAPTRCFSVGGRLHPSLGGRAGPLRLSNGAESSSLALRLTSLPLQGFANRDGSLPALGQLLVQRTIYKVNSFRFTRSAGSADSRFAESLRLFLQIRAPSFTSNPTRSTARMRFSLTSLPRRPV
jgi:hypothetical protein